VRHFARFDRLLTCVYVVNGVDHRKRKRSPTTNAQDHHREKRAVSRVKETPEQTQFKEFLSNLYTVFLESDPVHSRPKRSRDPLPSVMNFLLPIPQNEAVEAPNVKRAKLEASEESRTFADKLSNNEYTNIGQIEVCIFYIKLTVGRSIGRN
jgi:hypothetical protein